MNNINHTPTPWTIGSKMADGSIPILDQCNGVECIIACVHPNFTNHENAHQEANVALFLAAPELLRECEEQLKDWVGVDESRLSNWSRGRLEALRKVVAMAKTIRDCIHDKPRICGNF